MDAMQAILTRRSIRKYSGEPVSDELVEQLLRAAMSAPSAGNEQPWHFVVVREQAQRQALADLHPHAKMLPEADVAIVVCGDLELEKYEGYWVQDCSAATENLLIAANALGLGAVWLGVHPRAERAAAVQGVIGLPPTVIPLCIVSVGHPGEQKPASERFQTSRIHHERW